MGTLAHVLEENGIATAMIASMRGQVERLRPPRALYCDFPLGRPLGVPGDAEFQHKVLRALLALFHEPHTPVLHDFPDVIVDSADHPLACAIPPRFDPTLPAAVDEALAYRPAYERQRTRSGRTLVGRVLSADTVPAAVAAFVRIDQGAPWREAQLPGSLYEVALDVRAYFEEAAIALADHVPAARAAETWFFQTTEVGQLIRRIRQRLMDANEPRRVWFSMAPRNQQ